MLERRFPMVPVDSSAARIPFPGVPMYVAFLISSSTDNQPLITSYQSQITSFLMDSPKIHYLYGYKSNKHVAT